MVRSTLLIFSFLLITVGLQGQELTSFTGRLMSARVSDRHIPYVGLINNQHGISQLTNEEGYFRIDSLIVDQKYEFRVISMSYSDTISIIPSLIEDTVEFHLYAICKYDSLRAIQDIQNATPMILLFGGIAPTALSESDLNFELNYGVKYYQSGCIHIADECMMDYHRVIFQWLDSNYGTVWREELNVEVVKPSGY